MRLAGLLLVATLLPLGLLVPRDALGWDGYVVRVEDSNCIAVSEKADSGKVRARLFFSCISAPSGKKTLAV